MPCVVDLHYVIVVFPDHTHLPLKLFILRAFSLNDRCIFDMSLDFYRLA